MASPENAEAAAWQGRDMIGSDGEKIGRITQIYEDPQSGRAEWATVSSGLFGTKSNFVPLAGAAAVGKQVRVDVTKLQVKDAPGVEADDDLSPQEEQRLFEHYGVPYAIEGTAETEGDRGRLRRQVVTDVISEDGAVEVIREQTPPA
jgi:hypothetical protein